MWWIRCVRFDLVLFQINYMSHTEIESIEGVHSEVCYFKNYAGDL